MVRPFTSNGCQKSAAHASRSEVGAGAILDAAVDDERNSDEHPSGSEDAAEEGDDWDDWEEDTKTPTYSLITPAVLLPSIEQAFEHDMLKYGFCIKRLMQRLNLDCIARIKIINWIRSGTQYGRSKEELDSLTGEESWFHDQSDEWYIPRIKGDGMLRMFS